MKNIIFPIAILFSLLVACKDDDQGPSEKMVNPNETIDFKVKETVTLESDGTNVTLLAITEDSRCPTNANCFWEGRVVAEFEVEKDGKTVARSLTDNPANDPLLSTSFTAFGHSFALVEVTPHPDGDPIEQSDYVVKVNVNDDSKTPEAF